MPETGPPRQPWGTPGARSPPRVRPVRLAGGDRVLWSSPVAPSVSPGWAGLVGPALVVSAGVPGRPLSELGSPGARQAPGVPHGCAQPFWPGDSGPGGPGRSEAGSWPPPAQGRGVGGRTLSGGFWCRGPVPLGSPGAREAPGTSHGCAQSVWPGGSRPGGPAVAVPSGGGLGGAVRPRFGGVGWRPRASPLGTRQPWGTATTRSPPPPRTTRCGGGPPGLGLCRNAQCQPGGAGQTRGASEVPAGRSIGWPSQGWSQFPPVVVCH